MQGTTPTLDISAFSSSCLGLAIGTVWHWTGQEIASTAVLLYLTMHTYLTLCTEKFESSLSLFSASPQIRNGSPLASPLDL